MEPVTTDNYATIAQRDETASTSVSGGASKPQSVARAARIAQAVERSKTEYQPQHAYTERGWILQQHDTRDGASIYKAERHRFEYLITSLYYAVPPEHTKALNLVLEALDPGKPLGGLSREIIDMGTRCALASGDAQTGVKLAWYGKDYWRAPFVGLAESAADAFLAAGQPQDALRPLLLAAAAGEYQPISRRLAEMIQDRPEPNLQAFYSMLLRRGGSVDPEALAADLHLESDLHQPLREALKRLQRGTLEEPKEKSVREL